MKRNQGISLIEILVSCVIIALLVGGLASVFVSGSRWLMNIRAQSAAEEISKLFLDPMQMHVRQNSPVVGSEWNGVNNALTLGTTHCETTPTGPQSSLCAAVIGAGKTIGKVDYDVDYTIQSPIINGVIQNNVRKVTTTIRWREPDSF